MREIACDNFWQEIHLKAREKAIPLRVMFELTYDCNFKCRHCYVPASFRRKYKKTQLKTREVFLILDQLKDAGCLFLGFTGGEPLVRDDAQAILEYARKKGFQSILYTNGSRVDERIAKALAENPPNKVDITLPGISAPVFEGITNIPGSRQQVFRGIELLRANKINLGFKTCVLKQNSAEIKKIEKFCRSRGSGLRLDTLLSRCLDGSAGPYKYREAAETEFKPARSLGCVKTKRSRRLSGVGSLFRCGAGISQAAITPAGELKLCLMIDYPKYNLLKLGFNRAWARLRSLVEEIKPDADFKCPVCGLRNYCKWCPARSWLYNRSFTSCDPQAKLWAQKMKENHGC